MILHVLVDSEDEYRNVIHTQVMPAFQAYASSLQDEETDWKTYYFCSNGPLTAKEFRAVYDSRETCCWWAD